MKTGIGVLVAVMLALVSPTLSAAPGAAAADIVFKDANVIPMTGETVLEGCSVYVSGGKIEAIGRFGDLSFPSSAVVVDASGRYLIPGLCDAHVHANYPEEASLYLANGVTLVRVMWGYPELLQLRDGIRRKELPGPEIFTTGPIIDGSPGYWPGSLIIDDPALVPAAIEKIKDDGYDAVKVYDGLSPGVYGAIIEAAGRVGLPVWGHVPRQVGIARAIEAGQRSIEHLDAYLREAMRSDDQGAAIIELTSRSGVRVCPTLVVMRRFYDVYSMGTKKISGLAYVPAARIEAWKKERMPNPRIQVLEDMLKRLSEAGARVVAGTDTGNPYVIAGFSLREELAIMQDAGLSPYRVLLSATAEPARLLGVDDRLGTIEAGKDADLVLLKRNPLTDARNVDAIAGVMVKGAWLPEKELRRMLGEAKKSLGD